MTFDSLGNPNHEHQDTSKLLKDAPGIVPLLPMLYVAWADGMFTEEEFNIISTHLQAQPWFNETEKVLISRWLNPTTPPSPQQLQYWLELIQEIGQQVPPEKRKKLADLGLEIARIGTIEGYQRCSTPEVCAALDEVENALGVISNEVIEELLTTVPPPPPPAEQLPTPEFNIQQLQQVLDGEYPSLREEIKLLLSQPEFSYQYGLSRNEYREVVFNWVKKLANKGYGALSFPEEFGGKGDMGAFIAVFETLGYHDLSLLTKFGVQFGLFGGSILNLGTQKHHEKYLHQVADLTIAGCFAMTETGHGSNVRDIKTIARYDSATDEFIINTPEISARKDYIGNAALHGQLATVFAQLEINGKQYGVHAFLVPIRSASGSLMPGVHVEDNGEKMGLNGVDNGRIQFKDVRIPRENLLDRYAQISSQGEYSSSITSPSQRFFTMLGTLVGGRISIAAAALSAAKSALTIAVRYAYQRRQFGPPGNCEVKLIDYPSHQKRLIPRLAKTYAIHFALQKLIGLYSQQDQNNQREIEVLAAGLKAYSSWHTTDTIQEARESCGAQGYLAENRFASLKADSDIFTTFEGDNTVLLQLVAKGCLSDFRHSFAEMKFPGLIKYIARKASTTIQELNPVITRITDESHLRDFHFLLNAFRYREDHLLITAARRLKKRIDNGIDSFTAFSQCQNHLLALANAFVERVILEEFIHSVEKIEEESLGKILTKLIQLFGLAQLEKDKGWFLENGYIEGNKAKAIRREVEKLSHEIAPQAVHLTSAFGIPNALLAAPIALNLPHNQK